MSEGKGKTHHKKSHHKSHKKSQKKSHQKKTALQVWNSGGNLSNSANANDFLRYGTMTSVAENSTKLVVPFDGKLSGLAVRLVTSSNTGDASPGDGKIRNFTIRINGVDTALTVAITGDAVTGDNASEVPVNKFDLISIKHNTNTDITKNAIGIASIVLSQK